MQVCKLFQTEGLYIDPKTDNTLIYSRHGV